MINYVTGYSVLWRELVGLSELTAAFDSVACSHDTKLISRWANMIVYAVLKGGYYVQPNFKAVSGALNFKTHS